MLVDYKYVKVAPLSHSSTTHVSSGEVPEWGHFLIFEAINIVQAPFIYHI
jgi:hypothetical protein